MIQNRTAVALPTFLSLGMMGAFHAFWGTTLPALSQFLQINIEQAAALTAYNQAGQAVACILGGLVSDLVRRDKVLLLGCLLLGSGAFLLGGSQSYLMNILLTFWLGLGCGLILSSSNALLIGMFPKRKGPIMNVHHSVYGGLSLLSPLIMAYLLSSDHSWRLGYEGLGWICAAACIFFVFTKVPNSQSHSSGNFVKDARSLLASANFIPLLLVAGLAVGTYVSVFFLCVTFLSGAKGLSVIEASAVLSAFFVCIFAGRIVCSWLSYRILNSKIILVLLFMQLACVIIAWLADGWTSAVALALSGLGSSGVFPCLLALTGTLYFKLAGTSMGILAAMNWVGGMVIVWAAGILSQRVSLSFGFIAMVISSFSALLIFSSKFKTLVQSERACVRSDR